MLLFDELERIDAGPASHSEDSYAYYNRSARIGVVRIRGLLQSWFDRYPPPDQAELKARFRADFDSAFFELFLHELILRLGVSVELHPALPTASRTRPDFKLSDEQYVTYLEASVSRDASSVEMKKKKVIATIYDQFRSISYPSRTISYGLWI